MVVFRLAGKNVSIINAGKPGVTSLYMSSCGMLYVPQDADMWVSIMTVGVCCNTVYCYVCFCACQAGCALPDSLPVQSFNSNSIQCICNDNLPLLLHGSVMLPVCSNAMQHPH
jgi:hypothetical protein